MVGRRGCRHASSWLPASSSVGSPTGWSSDHSSTTPGRRLASGLPVVRPRLVPMVGVAALLVVVGSTASSADGDGDYDFAGAVAAFGARPTGEPTAATHPGRGVRRVDRADERSRPGIDWSDASTAISIVDGDVRLGCGLLETGERPPGAGCPGRADVGPRSTRTCGGWPRAWQRSAHDRRVDDAVVFFGVWEIADWRIDGGSVTSIDDSGLPRPVAAPRSTGRHRSTHRRRGRARRAHDVAGRGWRARRRRRGPVAWAAR